MKIRILCFTLLTAMLFLCGCTPQDTTKREETTTIQKVLGSLPKKIEKYEGELENFLKTHLNPPLEDLTEIPYTNYSFGVRGATPRGQTATGSIADEYNLEKFSLYIGPIEHITIYEDGKAYAIMKLVRDDGKFVYVYRFFWQSASGYGYEEWHTFECEVYYLTNSLTYNEFSASFATGDTMEQAIAISPGLEFDLDMRYDYNPVFEPHRAETVTQTCHLLLEDGVAVLRFESTCTTDEWEAAGKPNNMLVCNEMTFYPNGTEVTVDGIELTVLTCPADKRPPLPQDTTN